MVRRLRTRSGLSQAELARRARTSRTRLSAYEHGRTDPGLETLERIAAAAGAEIAIVTGGTRRIADHIDQVRAALGEGDEAYALRLVADVLSWVRDGRVAFEALAHDPGTTHDARWDALIGGVVEMLADETGNRVPGWASAPGRFLADPWFVSRLRSVRPFVFRETPPALASRCVFVSADSLRSA